MLRRDPKDNAQTASAQSFSATTPTKVQSFATNPFVDAILRSSQTQSTPISQTQTSNESTQHGRGSSPMTGQKGRSLHPIPLPHPILTSIECETALQLHVRNIKGTSVLTVGKLPVVKAGQVMEIAGPTGAGKTELLMRYLSYILLPRIWICPSSSTESSHQHNGISRRATPSLVPLNGIAARVLLIDLDIRFSVSALADLMRAYIQSRLLSVLKKLPEVSEAAISALIKSSLARLIVTRPTTPTSLLATLLAAPSTFLKAEMATSTSPGESSESRFVLIDGYSSMYWLNRVDDFGCAPVGGYANQTLPSTLKLSGVRNPTSRVSAYAATPSQNSAPDSVFRNPAPVTPTVNHSTSSHRAILRAIKMLKAQWGYSLIITRNESSTGPQRAGPNGVGAGQGGSGVYKDAQWMAMVDRYITVGRENVNNQSQFTFGKKQMRWREYYP
ncbi:hypothetical protein DFS34DRAFT_590710 [Phlyctochytrium arcticum]|nr:hypothetical protein DFS34DRAFT_590710 [Phlyctochytrium arcticum]